MYNELVKVTKKKQIHDTENKLVVTSEEKGRGRRRGKREAGKGRPRPLGVRRLRTHWEQLFNISVPQFPHLLNGDKNNSAYALDCREALMS